MTSFTSTFLSVMVTLFMAGAVPAAESAPRILFDQGHNQRFLIEDQGELQLSRFAAIMRAAGARVASTKIPLSDDSLQETTALVISGPFQSLAPDEVEAVVRFMERGGRLAAMLHIGPPLSGLLARLDLDHSNAVLHERANVIDADLNFRVTALSGSPLFSGVTYFSVYGCWALDPGARATTIAATSPDAWVDLDGDNVLSHGDVRGAFTVALSGTRGRGSFVLFGDDALFQNRYLDEQNGRLAANLAVWLAGR